ncbi:RND type efflux pump [Isoalcanivorax pacificus W11-5]|uniref:RND type efflux pump n=1 Tax=Isoalcanivorax pacificus W11-5 TaxID=391936 RepID=A0A0B4XJS4_9GAMM|nr:putative solute-binding protein [Isoalcanivorax pacificus]AJD46813.1 RND type efflux pump [Isoalcanivorax pacificus W11-5]
MCYTARICVALIAGWLGALACAAALADSPARSLCVFSVQGTQGELFGQMRDFAVAAQTQGVTLTPRVLVDERIAAEDFKADQCDAALLTGIRARAFNPFAGSIDAIGGLPDYDALRTLITLLARPELAPRMRQGPYEVAGIMPLGAAYIFLNDRRINSVEKIAGKRLAVFEHDAAQLMMAQRIGAQPVLSDVSNFSGKFNNGVVDVIAAPAIAYMALELYRGVGAHGVVVDMPVAQLTFQLVIRHQRFPEGFGHWARQYFLALFDPALKVVIASENEMLFFFPPPDSDAERYQLLLQESRIALTDAGHYDRQMMQLMKRVRCAHAPENAECSDARE